MLQVNCEGQGAKLWEAMHRAMDDTAKKGTGALKAWRWYEPEKRFVHTPERPGFRQVKFSVEVSGVGVFFQVANLAEVDLSSIGHSNGELLAQLQTHFFPLFKSVLYHPQRK